MSDDLLQTPVQFVKGVGPDRAELLQKLEIRTAGDLLWHLPRDLLDLSDVRKIADLEADQPASVLGTVVDLDSRSLARERTMSAILIESDGNYLRALWFNQTWVLKKYQPGQRLLLSGKPKFRAGRWEISHPRVQVLEADDGSARGEVLPRYPLTEGLRMDVMRRMTRHAVEHCAEALVDPLPEAYRAEHELPSLPEALRMVHAPRTAAEWERGRARLIGDDLLEFQLGVALRRRAWEHKPPAPRLPVTPKIDSRIRKLFPFTMTRAQDQVIVEIGRDLDSDTAMHRLLQADVGAGKTAVAIYAMLVCVAAGHQAVLMAPTEVLARQHWETLASLLHQSRVERRLLTGGLTAAEKARVHSDIQSGTAQLVVGTQAVIQDAVRFASLGLAVVDEQHKFGVLQRAQFSTGGLSPHVLVMTATPIPRSLCLTQFGDLDLSVMDELPPGRQRVVTSLVTEGAPKLKAFAFLRKQIEQGRQAYIVCPRIANDAAGSGPADVETVFRYLTTGPLQGLRIAALHGQLDSDEKGRIMAEFEEGSLDALISTTVVEVGIDVPNATLMVILDAERFGLSQLHQLRGRISRGRFQGYCFLFTRSDAADALSRLNVLTTTTDGFQIAEADFEFRGPGDILGTRQHGQLPLIVADLVRDRAMLETARERATDLVKSGRFDAAEFAPLKKRVLDRFRTMMDLPQSG